MDNSKLKKVNDILGMYYNLFDVCAENNESLKPYQLRELNKGLGLIIRGINKDIQDNQEKDNDS